jgi:hypothetical protein
MMCSRYLFSFIFILTGFSGSAQYYYKDILVSRQTQETWKTSFINKVNKVKILSMDKSGEPTPGFVCTQTIAAGFHSIQTFTESLDVPSSILTTFYNDSGRVIKTVDSSDTYKSTTEYQYSKAGRLLALSNIALETDNKVEAAEKHIWVYKDERPVQMIKIRGGSDTTTVNFTADEKGNIIEERPVRGKENLPAVYYYYDNDGRLTDIVRYNEKAGRLLPDYIFGYNQQDLSSMIFVPPGSNDYQRWTYKYDPRGLKTSETCFNKRKEIIARISYQYNFQ